MTMKKMKKITVVDYINEFKREHGVSVYDLPLGNPELVRFQNKMKKLFSNGKHRETLELVKTLPSPNHPPLATNNERVFNIATMLLNGMTNHKIAEKLGLSINKVTNPIQKYALSYTVCEFIDMKNVMLCKGETNRDIYEQLKRRFGINYSESNFNMYINRHHGYVEHDGAIIGKLVKYRYIRRVIFSQNKNLYKHE